VSGIDVALALLVGERIRTTRTAQTVSLSRLAATAGIGKGSLSEIEQGSRNPTLGTLYALARALGVPLSWLLAEQVGAEAASEALSSRLLDVDADEHATVETYAITVQPGLEHRSRAHGLGIREHLLLTRGRLAAGLVGAEVLLEPGESHAWTSDGEHLYRTIGTQVARGILTITWPGSSSS
jgi:transcriptional regulator with XRE-family HTH domain